MIFYVIKVNKRRNIEFIKNCRTDGLRPRKINFQCPPNNGERILDSVEDVANDDLRAFTEPRLITFTHCFEPMKTQPQIRQIAAPLAAQNAMQEAADLLRGGGVIVCATDTGYLLGVDALNVTAARLNNTAAPGLPVTFCRSTTTSNARLMWQAMKPASRLPP